MTEDQARAWLERNLNVSRETFDLLERLIAATIVGNEVQNLVARSTFETIWNRHIVDSAQLLAFTDRASTWIDLGSGAGFPGLVVALLRPDDRMTLVEERKKRAEHLREVVADLVPGGRVDVIQKKVEQVAAKAHDVISARAFAPLDRLFAVAHHLSGPKTLWLLPKGKSHASELEAVRRTWQGSFKVIPSVTDPEGAIIIATNVQPRRRR